MKYFIYTIIMLISFNNNIIIFIFSFNLLYKYGFNLRKKFINQYIVIYFLFFILY